MALALCLPIHTKFDNSKDKQSDRNEPPSPILAALHVAVKYEFKHVVVRKNKSVQRDGKA